MERGCQQNDSLVSASRTVSGAEGSGSGWSCGGGADSVRLAGAARAGKLISDRPPPGSVTGIRCAFQRMGRTGRAGACSTCRAFNPRLYPYSVVMKYLR